MASKELTKAVAYIRTSSMTNVGEDKDLARRQRDAIVSFAKRAGYVIVDEYTDEGVKGADAIDERPGFAAALARITGNGVRTIIVETASRFARDLIVQEVGYRRLRDTDVTLIAADFAGQLRRRRADGGHASPDPRRRRSIREGGARR